MSNHTNSKSAYTKPTLIEYGSLAERTKLFGLNPEASDLASVAPGTASVTISGATVTSIAGIPI